MLVLRPASLSRPPKMENRAAGLAVINAGGTYSQLVAAHVGERGAAQASIETQTANLDIVAYFSAVMLAGCAAWFSIKGMTVLFPGAPLAVVAMAIAMETAKLVTVGWLARRLLFGLF
jgi:hypothetical protein